jgi:AcrR family transcriptional regulator
MGFVMVYVESGVRSRQIVAAARVVITRDGVAGTTVRAVAQEAAIPLGTLQYVFPTKQQLLRAVIEDLVEELANNLMSSVPRGDDLESAIGHGIRTFWNELVVGDAERVQLAQYELTTYALRTAGLEDLARWQYKRYTDVVAGWLQRAAPRGGEENAFDSRQLARLVVAGVDGLIMQYVVNPDPDRGRDDIEAMISMVIHRADVRPAIES